MSYRCATLARRTSRGTCHTHGRAVSSARERLGRARRAALVLGAMCLALAGCGDGERDAEPLRGVTDATTPIDASSLGAFGVYHAVVIGIDGYTSWPPLRFAERDAIDIGSLLTAQYGFAPERITRLSGAGATRSQIMRALRDKLETLTETDNLLVFYAGHGQLDPLTESGYWIPVEGDLFDESTWIPFTTITSLLSASNVRAKNILVITDSCYGGALARSGPTPGIPRPDADATRYLAKLAPLAAKRSRQVIASGGYEQVPDESLFSGLLKQALTDNSLPAIDLELLFFSEIYPKLRVAAQQEPVMSRLLSGPELNGQFVLVRQAALVPSEPARLTVTSNVTGDRIRIDGEARGSTPLSAELQAGTYVIRVEKEGFAPFEEELTLAAGDARTLAATLVPAPPPTPPVADMPEPPAPKVVTLELAPATVRRGETFTLSWRTEHADRVEIRPLGEVALAGSRVLTADADTTFSLVASDSASERRATAEKSVDVKPALPSIDYFVARPAQIVAGRKVTLAWRTSESAVTYLDGFGSIAGDGTQDLTPESTTTYTLVAANADGEEVRGEVLVVVVEPEPLPTISRFDVEPAAITAGQVATLAWSSADAQSVEIDGVGAVRPGGSQEIKPAATTTYTLIAKNDTGAVRRQVTVTVTRPASVTPVRPVIRPELSRTEAVRPTLFARLAHSQGELAIQQNFTVDLDSGTVGASSGADVWFQAQTATVRMLTPRSPATLAFAGAQAPGQAGCANMALSQTSIPLERLGPGTFVCVKTSDGRLSQIEILTPAGRSPGTLKVRYITWQP
jgi:hypothetical protein